MALVKFAAIGMITMMMKLSCVIHVKNIMKMNKLLRKEVLGTFLVQ